MAEKLKASDMIREALAEGVSKPAEIEQWVQAKYKTTVTKSNINQVKQAAKKKATAGGNAAEPAPAAAPAAKPKKAVVVSLTIEEFNAINSLVKRYGKDGVIDVVNQLHPF